MTGNKETWLEVVAATCISPLQNSLRIFRTPLGNEDMLLCRVRSVPDL